MGDIGMRVAQAAFEAGIGPGGPAGNGVAVAAFAGFDERGRFLVALAGQAEPLAALSTVGLGAEDLGAAVIVAFEGGDPRCPVIVGCAQGRAGAQAAPATAGRERLVLQADREIELRCGDASIVLTRAGKVLIRGTYVLTRSRGANRIKGAFVDIN